MRKFRCGCSHGYGHTASRRTDSNPKPAQPLPQQAPSGDNSALPEPRRIVRIPFPLRKPPQGSSPSLLHAWISSLPIASLFLPRLVLLPHPISPAQGGDRNSAVHTTSNFSVT